MANRDDSSGAGQVISPHSLICASLILVALICLLCVGVLVSAYRDTVRNTENSTRNLSVALARDIARNIELANLSIQTIVDGLQGPGAAQYPDSVSCIVLFDHATTGKYFDATRYADANGDLVLDQRGGLLQNQNVAQREFFLFHQRDADPNLHIGLPFRVAQNPDRYEITLSRRVNRADGRFAGVVFATIKLDYFYQLLQNINVGAGGHVVLYRSDGAVLMEFPASTGNLARSMRGTESFKAISAAPDGFVTGPSALDSVNRLRAFRRVDQLPLILTVGVAVDDMLIGWREKALLIVIYTLLLSAATVALSFFLLRELKRRQMLELELQRIARTDSLTQLGNRRLFDEALKREWERAARLHKPLALLMLDIDWFKKYNDFYGHPAGDAALRAVALCIQQGVHRPGDICARYGGEEFTVVLPDTNLAGAYHVAEKIRRAVERLNMAHADSPHKKVTVSIGLAMRLPEPAQDAKQLIDAADAAMYRAKQAGRNRALAEQT